MTNGISDLQYWSGASGYFIYLFISNILYQKFLLSHHIYTKYVHCKNKCSKININVYEVLCIFKLWNLIYVCDQ